MRSKMIFYFFLLLFIISSSNASAVSDSNGTAAGKNPQKVDGLLFDLDEGVKVTKGGGGSVYIESNREFMQAKFDQIEERLKTLEEKIKKLTDKVSIEEEKQQVKLQNDERQVLAT